MCKSCRHVRDSKRAQFRADIDFRAAAPRAAMARALSRLSEKATVPMG